MAKDPNWEFDCPQYIDFTEADQGNEDAEAYFDINHESKGSFRLLSECPKLGDLKKQDFSAKLEDSSTKNSTAVVTKYANVRKSRTTSERKANDSAKLEKLSFTYIQKSTAHATKAITNRLEESDNHLTNRIHQEITKAEINIKSSLKDAPALCNLLRPMKDKNTSSSTLSFMKAKTFVPIKPESTMQGCQRKRSMSASEITSISKKKKVTLPTTPLCLRRTLGKPRKTIKSTEELEMEKIAAFRKQLVAQRKANEVLMKRVTKPSYTNQQSVIYPSAEFSRSKHLKLDKGYHCVSKKNVKKHTQSQDELQAIYSSELSRSQLGKTKEQTENNVKLSGTQIDGMDKGVKTSNVRTNQCRIVKDTQKMSEGMPKCQLENRPDVILPHHENKYYLRSSCKKIGIPPELSTFRVPVIEKNINGQAVNAVTNLNNLLTSHPGLPFSSKRERKFTHIQPFSFDIRDQIRLAGKAQKIQDELEKCVKVQEFHARPAPKANPVSWKERSRRITKEIKPYSTDVQAKANALADKWQKDVEDELEKQREALFKAQPASVLSKAPFVPQKSSKPLTEITNIRLNTAERAIEREKFEEKKRVKEAMQKEENEQLKEKLLKEERIYTANLRAQLIQKATPIKCYKQIEVKSNKKAQGLLMCNLKMR